VVHDCTILDKACATKLKVTVNVTKQITLGFQSLSLAEWHYLEHHSLDTLLCYPLPDCGIG